MKIGGKALVSRTKAEVTVVRGDDRYTMVLTSLPVGWHDSTVTQRLIPPVPPEKFVTDESGRIVKGANKQVQTKPDYNNPDYRVKADVWQQRYNALAVCDLLRDDETVTWEASPPESKGKPEEWEAFADQILAELNAAGFTDSDLAQILELGKEIATSVDTEGAMKRFLSSQGLTTEPVEA